MSNAAFFTILFVMIVICMALQMYGDALSKEID